MTSSGMNYTNATYRVCLCSLAGTEACRCCRQGVSGNYGAYIYPDEWGVLRNTDSANIPAFSFTMSSHSLKKYCTYCGELLVEERIGSDSYGHDIYTKKCPKGCK